MRNGKLYIGILCRYIDHGSIILKKLRSMDKSGYGTICTKLYLDTDSVYYQIIDYDKYLCKDDNGNIILTVKAFTKDAILLRGKYKGLVFDQIICNTKDRLSAGLAEGLLDRSCVPKSYHLIDINDLAGYKIE